MISDLAAPDGAASSGRSTSTAGTRDRAIGLTEKTKGPPSEAGFGFAEPRGGPALFTFAEAAVRMRIPERTLRLLVARHSPPVIKAGRRVLFDDFAITHLIESLRCPSGSSPSPRRVCSGYRAPSAANAFAKALH